MTDFEEARITTTTTTITMKPTVMMQYDMTTTMTTVDYGDAVYKRLEYLLNEIRSNISLNFNEISTEAANTDGNLLLFNNKNELQVYLSQLRVEIIDRQRLLLLHHHKSCNQDDLFNEIEIYEKKYLKLLKTYNDYLDLCDRFLNLLTIYRKSAGNIRNPQGYFNNMLINFELLRRNLANKKIKLEKLILKQEKLILNEYGQLCYEILFNNDLSKGDEQVKSNVSENKIDLVKTFDYKNFKLTYNQLQRVRETYFHNDNDVYICHTPYYYSDTGLVLQKFSKKTGLLENSAEIERKYAYRSIIFDKTCIMLLLKHQSNKPFSYILHVYDLNLNLINRLKLNMNTNILSINLSNEKLYVFTEFKLYIYNQHDLKQLKSLKFEYDDYSSFKLSFIDNEFYKANILISGRFIFYQDTNFNFNILEINEEENSVKLSQVSGLLKLQNYELSYIDHLSRIYLINKKQKSILICNFDGNTNKFEILDEYFFINIQSISSIHVTNEATLIINDFASYRTYFYKI